MNGGFPLSLRMVQAVTDIRQGRHCMHMSWPPYTRLLPPWVRTSQVLKLACIAVDSQATLESLEANSVPSLEARSEHGLPLVSSIRLDNRWPTRVAACSLYSSPQ